MNITNYGYIPEIYNNGNNESSQIPARITASYKGRFEISSDKGPGWAYLKKGAYLSGDELYPTTGDFVLTEYQDNNEFLIIKTLPRKTVFTRLDPSSSGHGAQAIAANFDYVFILQSLNHDFNISRLCLLYTSRCV